MPILKTYAGHDKTVAKLQRRLEYEAEAALAIDLINVTDRLPPDGLTWSQNMDATRRLAENDKPHNGRRPRTFMHYVIYPDPRDEIDLPRLQALAYDWAYEFFDDYEVAIVYHTHGSVGLHAHVVVNNTNLCTGERIGSHQKHSAYYSRGLQRIALSQDLRALTSDRRSLTPAEFEAEDAHVGRPAPANSSPRPDERNPS